MSISDCPWWRSGLILMAALVLGACDRPAGEPSLRTRTSLSAPLIAKKTYAFLGGPESDYEPLLDTTSSKSLRRVHRLDGKISINQGFRETLVDENDALATQTIDRTFELSLASSDSKTSPPPKASTVSVRAKDTIDVQKSSSKNDNFAAVDVDEGSTLDIRVENHSSTRLEDVQLSITNSPDAAADFEDIADIPSLDVTRSLGTIGTGESASTTVRSWEDPDRAVKEQVIVSVSADATLPPGGFDATDNLTVSLGGDDGNTVKVQTLYFRPDGDTLDATGSLDLINNDRAQFGSDTYVGLIGAHVDVGGLDVEGGPAPPRYRFDTFRLRYPDDVRTAPYAPDDVFDVDLVARSGFTGNFDTCPCSPTVSLEKNARFYGLEQGEEIEFELVGTLASGRAIVNLGDEVFAAQTGFPVAELFEVNWGLSGDESQAVTIRDTTSANLSGLADLADPAKNFNVSAAALELTYENTLPLSGRLRLTIVDANGDVLRTLHPTDESGTSLRVRPAPKGDDGRATGSVRETLSLRLGDSRREIQQLARGEALRLRLDLTQEQGPPARLRASDTVQFSLQLDADASIDTTD